MRDSALISGLVTVQLWGSGAGLRVFEPIPAVVEGLKALWARWRDEEQGEATTTDLRRREVAIAPQVLGAAIGPLLHLPFHEGKLLLAPYHEVMVIDFETVARRREILLHVMGEGAGPPAKGAAGRPMPPRGPRPGGPARG